MSFITDTNRLIAQSIDSYSRCDSNEQAMLRVLSVINKRIGQTKFKAVLSELGHCESFYGQKLHTQFTPEARQALVQRGLINSTREGLRIADHLADYLTRICLNDGSFEDIIECAEIVVPIEPMYHWNKPLLVERQRQVRDCFYRGQYTRCIALLEFNKNPQTIDLQVNQVLIEVCFYPFNTDVFIGLPPALQYQALASLLQRLRRDLTQSTELELLLSAVVKQRPDYEPLRLLLAEQYLHQGLLHAASELLSSQEKSSYGLQLLGWQQFLNGQPQLACELFAKAIVAKNRIARRKKQYIGEMPGLMFGMALLQRGLGEDPAKISELKQQLECVLDDYRVANHMRFSYMMLKQVVQVLAGKLDQFTVANTGYSQQDDYYSHIEVIFGCLCSHWTKNPLNAYYQQNLVKCVDKLATAKQDLFAGIGFTLLEQYGLAPLNSLIASNFKSPPVIDLCQIVERKAPWALALEQLIAMNQSPQQVAASEMPPVSKQTRLVWLLDPTRYSCHFEAKEQKLAKSGWSKGRAISLKRLSTETASFDYLSAGDLAMCLRISGGYSSGFSRGYSGREYYELAGYSALSAAAGLDNLYLLEQPMQSVSIVESEPELLVTQNAKGYLLSMANIPSNFEDGEACYSLTKENSQRYRLVRYQNKHLEIAGIVGEGGLVVPNSAKDQVLQSISAIAPLLNIQSDVTGLETGIEQRAADSRLYINIAPAGQGLEFSCQVQPLGTQGPAMSPGLGNPTLSAQIDGERLTTTRQLDDEKKQLQYLMQQCPAFQSTIDGTVLLDQIDDSLHTLEQLESILSDDDDLKIALQWPKGKTFKLSQKLGPQHMQLAMTKQKEWFSLDGSLTVGDDQVVELKNLMALLSQSNSRFVKLDDGQILSLTEELRQRLTDLGTVSEDGKFHVLASPLIDAATQGMRLKTLHSWQKQRLLLEQAEQLEPQLPSTLQAQLRDYQLDGFNWATRLASWGGGACLADDMGLGKTLQALAVILDRAPSGPSLVLAPTSVCFNWQQEATRFAPTLRVKIFGVDTTTIEQRHHMLEQAQAFDVIICSYGLLQREGERLAKVNWRTIVADEAQALKNPLAKRTQAALALKGDFKMVTTGTPIENNLNELWSLFRFINPGLLGAQKQFHQRFANPMESSDSDESAMIRANQALRKLISPFILRRMKNQVLTELPSRTEINISVELSEPEVVLYEALRQQAIENLAKDDEQPGQHHIKMLAEIMRLRRACCHPDLVMPDAGIEGSKLKVFDNLIDELQQNNHKALVFSQFVGHLKILRQHLDNKGVKYQYLDGSTPAKARRDRVNAFQAGDGDVFLISLKAGGSGLNLTAADYVIHMDPWWNPAVEDQASDRAHRMGQTRPVTIYRLIAKNTIEDKILALHQQKRDLANSLLDGNDSSDAISAQDMMALLQQQI